MHSSEDSYDDWYYGGSGGVTAAEQDFYHLVPVISGAQGDYHSRGATTADDGPGLPGGMMNGDMNTPGTLLHDTWAALQAAPAGRLRDLGVASFLTMIYETAWHEEDALNYANSCYGPWQYPDASWDGVSAWALRLSNHVRDAGLYAAAASWADSVRTAKIGTGATPVAYAADLDRDGQDEYVLRSSRVFAVFERWGGRCVLACAWSRTRQDADVVIGAPFTNPSAPGEEEYATASANRCSAFKVMNGGTRADEATSASVVYPNPLLGIPDLDPSIGWKFTSPDGQLSKSIFLDTQSATLWASLDGTLASPVYMRFGLSPNPLDLARYGQAHLAGSYPNAGQYQLVNANGGYSLVTLHGDAAFNSAPANENSARRNLALTEEVEVSGSLPMLVTLKLGGDTTDPTNAVGPPGEPVTRLAMSTPRPSPSRGGARFSVSLPAAAPVRWALLDVAGRAVDGADLGLRPAGTLELAIAPSSARAPGLYLVRVESGGESVTRRWAVVR